MPRFPTYDLGDALMPPRRDDIEEQFRRFTPANVLVATIKRRGESYRVKFILTGPVPEGTERTRMDFELSGAQSSRLILGWDAARNDRLDSGAELTLRWLDNGGCWQITDTPSTPLSPQPMSTEPLPPTTRNRAVLDIDEYAALPQEVRDQIEYANEDRRTAEVRFRSTQTRLRNSQALADDYRNKNDQLQDRVDALERLKVNNEATIERQGTSLRNLEQATRHNESILADTDTLRRTAAVWRDAAKGTPAKLRAFKEFCTALDSLPALPAGE